MVETFVGIVEYTLIVVLVVTYLGFGLTMAHILRNSFGGKLYWWQLVLITTLWPVAIVLPLLLWFDWLRRGRVR